MLSASRKKYSNPAFRLCAPCTQVRLSVNCQVFCERPCGRPSHGPKLFTEASEKAMRGPSTVLCMGKPGSLRPKPKRNSFTTLEENSRVQARVAWRGKF